MKPQPLICSSSIADLDGILCRASFDAPNTPATEIMYMPAGVQTIRPSQDGRSVTVQVMVDRRGAEALEAQRASMEQQGRRPYFDLGHDNREASFWPTEFYWRDGDASGIYARGEWSDLGAQAITGKRYRQFSPVFFVNDVKAKPARIVARADARPNMGGLVNDPAFHAILPLWANDAGAPGEPTNQNQLDMNEQEVAALRARINSLEQQVAGLSTSNSTDAAAQLAARQAELRTAQAELRAEESRRQAEALQARNQALEAADLQRRQVGAREYAAAMVTRGALAARDTTAIAEVEANMTANPDQFRPIYDRYASNPALATSRANGGSGTQSGALSARASGVGIVHSDPRTVFGAMGALIARQQGNDVNILTRMEISREIGALYASEFRGENGQRILDAPLSAADNTDGSLGILSGTLVTQRTLELLRLQFPVLNRVTTDFSDMPAQFNQTIISRIIGIPAASDYDATNGWTDSTAATTDVPVTINKHKGVPITFNQNILASTVRRLFEEFAPASSYALAKAMVDDLYANITDAKFTNNTVATTAGFARSNVIDMGTALTLRGVPQGDMNRTLLLYPTVFAKLAQDTSLVSFAAFQRPDLFESGRQGVSTGFAFPVHGFAVQEAQNLLTNNGNITGFGFSRSALVVAARVPNDYTSVLPGASYGNVSVVTDPDIGLSVMLVQYVDHKKGTATQRIALMYGTAAGQGNAGQLLKAAVGSGSSQA